MRQYNIANLTNYKLTIPGHSNINYFIQSAELPGISLDGVATPYQSHGIFIPGDQFDFDTLNISFIVDEDYTNYKFLLNWLRQVRAGAGEFDLRTINLHLLTNNKTKGFIINFNYSFPTSIGSLSFNSGVGDTQPAICNAIFRFQDFDISTNDDGNYKNDIK